MEDASQVQVASEMNLSSQRVSQIEKEALKKLSAMEVLQQIHDEVYGYDSHLAYGITVKKAVDNHTSSTEMLAMKRLEYEEKYARQQNKLNNIFDELLEGK